ncbi:uncharacterized protein LOC133499502 isoform X2 [Syngnathoides biaculeatus]|nr:uncharacterized protein LOC133499502 isoform X2 [Syngnathoides biaculeatus]XP_061673569.1 uncharacterized protein LOC133499502 isoform X2 [Syngnathoides biaculeatus]
MELRMYAGIPFILSPHGQMDKYMLRRFLTRRGGEIAEGSVPYTVGRKAEGMVRLMEDEHLSEWDGMATGSRSACMMPVRKHEEEKKKNHSDDTIIAVCLWGREHSLYRVVSHHARLITDTASPLAAWQALPSASLQHASDNFIINPLMLCCSASNRRLAPAERTMKCCDANTKHERKIRRIRQTKRLINNNK